MVLNASASGGVIFSSRNKGTVHFTGNYLSASGTITSAGGDELPGAIAANPCVGPYQAAFSGRAVATFPAGAALGDSGVGVDADFGVDEAVGGVVLGVGARVGDGFSAIVERAVGIDTDEIGGDELFNFAGVAGIFGVGPGAFAVEDVALGIGLGLGGSADFGHG